jgi:ribosomal subunit interface protein
MIKIQGLHKLAITKAIEEHAKEQFSKVLKQFEMHIESSKLTLEVEKHTSKATVTIHLRGKDVVVHENGNDMYAVITSVAKKTLRVIRKNKEIRNTKQSNTEELYNSELQEHDNITLA